MRLCRFELDGVAREGVVEGDEVVDREGDGRHALSEVRLLAPVKPRKYLAIGLNYADHIAESGMEAPEHPIIFNKQTTCVVGPGDDVHMPRVSSLLDYEGELAIVIGERCRHVSEERAAEVIAGYTIANDLSVRDWQLRTPTMTMGKSFDTHGPLGPWVVTPDELGDPHALSIKTWVNDELRQDGNTAEMVFDCFQQVAHLSEAFTLEPGDVIATGTPAGVGAVRQPFPEGLLKVGDVVRIEIEGIGSLENTVVEEPEGFVVQDAGAEAAWGILTPELEGLLDRNRVGVLATVGPSGKPRQSVVYYAREGERLLISTVAGRLKARDVERSGWASLSVRGDEQPYPSATFSGPAAIRTEGIGESTARVMQRITGGEEPPPAQSDEALAEVGRVILELTIDRVGAASHLQPA